MKSYFPRLTKVQFFISYIATYSLITWLTFRDARPADGPLSLGFPLPFYHGGGLCMMPCEPHILWENLFLDILIIVTPIIVYSVYPRKVH